MQTDTGFSLSTFLAGLLISVGLIGFGAFTAKAIYQAKVSDHYVTVKGLAERQVKANLAAWEIDFQEADNDLTAANGRIQRDQQLVGSFLQKNGFNNSELELRPTKVSDAFANPYNSSNQAKYRYVITSGIRVRTSQVDLIPKASQQTNTLIQAGVPLSFSTSDYSSDLNPNPSYYFTQLDQIRPGMLSDATNSAYLIAQQFTKDTHTKLKGIRRASQGVFQIMSRDAASEGNNSDNQASSIYKKVRLVTTIDYFLKN